MPNLLHPGLNRAIIEMTKLVLPDGFVVAANTPSTFETLKAHLDAGQRLAVWSGGSHATIYDDPSVNYAFRAWHDWCHWRGDHDFTLAGEMSACEMQCDQLVMRFGDSPTTRLWCRIVRAEIIGQALFFDRHGRFPGDQRAFVESYLRNPTGALFAGS
jgi:hypothetical protein